MKMKTIYLATDKVILRVKIITLAAYIKIEQKSQICDFSFHLKYPEKEQVNPKVNRKRK